MINQNERHMSINGLISSFEIFTHYLSVERLTSRPAVLNLVPAYIVMPAETFSIAHQNFLDINLHIYKRFCPTKNEPQQQGISYLERVRG
jgi:hypothetical protein